MRDVMEVCLIWRQGAGGQERGCARRRRSRVYGDRCKAKTPRLQQLPQCCVVSSQICSYRLHSHPQPRPPSLSQPFRYPPSYLPATFPRAQPAPTPSQSSQTRPAHAAVRRRFRTQAQPQSHPESGRVRLRVCVPRQSVDPAWDDHARGRGGADPVSPARRDGSTGSTWIVNLFAARTPHSAIQWRLSSEDSSTHARTHARPCPSPIPMPSNLWATDFRVVAVRSLSFVPHSPGPIPSR